MRADSIRFTPSPRGYTLYNIHSYSFIVCRKRTAFPHIKWHFHPIADKISTATVGWSQFFNAYFIPETLLAGNPFSIFIDILKIRSLFAWVMICHKSWKFHTYKMTQTSAITNKQNSHPTQPKLVDLTDKIRFEKWSNFFMPSISFLGFVSVNSCCQ